VNVYLVGYRASGKSTVAPLVARRLGDDWRWVDMDERLERDAGRTIAEFFDQEGEPAFRLAESRLLAELAEQDRLVVATGGGVVLSRANRALLRKGCAVWLQGRPESLWSRLQSDPSTSRRRPNLTPAGGIEEIRRLLDERTPHYQEVARRSIWTEDSTPEELADALVESVRPLLNAGDS
jgi:shikimate kinase